MKSWKNWNGPKGQYDDPRAVRERALVLAIQHRAAVPRGTYTTRQVAQTFVDYILDGKTS